jgi:uncharacterized protein YwgA/O-acetyl-ADP-ribose deacetylase (regulator of RNase III)
MTSVRTGDILESKAQTLTNTVNCVGIMGKGIALAFKKRFPQMFDDYVRRCAIGKVRLGEPYLYRGEGQPWILNFPTKDHWRSLAKLEDIVRGLDYLARHYVEWGISSLAVPPLGCGNGELDWRVVGPTLYRYLSRLEIPVELYAPHGTPKEELTPSFLDSGGYVVGRSASTSIPTFVQPEWAVIVETLDRIEKEKYRWPIGRVTFQKLVYFLTNAGVPTGLTYERSAYGPFSQGLKRLTARLQNNGLIEEERDGNRFTVRVGPTYQDAKGVYQATLEQWKGTIDRYTDLFLRLNPRQAEIAATVSFTSKVAAEGGTKPASEASVLREVMDWKKGRQPAWDEGEVAEMIRDLNVIGIVKLEPSKDLPIGRRVLLTA